MARVVVELKDGSLRFVRAGEVVRDWHGRINGFRGLKLTASKSHAIKLPSEDAYAAASGINQAIDIGFYPDLGIGFAREGAAC